MRKLTLLISTLLLVTGLAACGSESGDSNLEKTEKTNDATTDKAGSEDVQVSAGEDKTVNEKNDSKEVEAYIHEVLDTYLGLAKLSEGWDELREASAAGEIDDYELGEIIIDEIAPLNLELLEELKAIRTPSDETAEINEILIYAIGKQQLAFTEIISVIDTGDDSKKTSANELLNDVRKNDIEFVRKLEKLSTEYNIELEYNIDLE